LVIRRGAMEMMDTLESFLANRRKIIEGLVQAAIERKSMTVGFPDDAAKRGDCVMSDTIEHLASLEEEIEWLEKELLAAHDVVTRATETIIAIPAHTDALVDDAEAYHASTLPNFTNATGNTRGWRAGRSQVAYEAHLAGDAAIEKEYSSGLSSSEVLFTSLLLCSCSLR